MANNIDNTASGMSGFVMGALVGAGVALLLAPWDGNETRRRLMQGGKQLGDQARKGMDQVRDRVDEIKGHVAEGVQQGKAEMTRVRDTTANRLG